MTTTYEPGVRKMIMKLKEFFHKEKEAKAPIIPFAKVNERVAAATGISLRTLGRILGEEKMASGRSRKNVMLASKNRKTRKDKIVMDNFAIGVLRRKTHEFYTTKNEIPTVNKIHQILIEEIGFKGSREVLRNYIIQIGFHFKRTKSNSKVLVERKDLSAWRINYLQAIKENEETEKLPVVYLDETYINSGLIIIVRTGVEHGFVENACLVFKAEPKSEDDDDMHDNTNHLNYNGWLTEKLVPYLREPSLIVMNNAPYHNTSMINTPKTIPKKGNIQEQFKPINAEFSANLEALGHKVLRLPPHHCDLNPIEILWTYMKQKGAEFNAGTTAQQMPTMVENAFNDITFDEWVNHCCYVKELEVDYREKDGHLAQPSVLELFSDTEDTDA